MVSTTNGFFVVLHHKQGVAAVAQRLQGIDKDFIVARMESYCGLVEYIANTLEIRAKLSRQPNALRFAA
jgi:hypothetical protein